ncbi:hypothetical protein KDX26_19395 [Burkholderia cenocepacia]|nr:hypothetical protein [Burkholderia cenocepacia]
MAFSPRNVGTHNPHTTVVRPVTPALAVPDNADDLFPERDLSEPLALESEPIDNGPGEVVTEAQLAGLLALIAEERYHDLNMTLAALAPETADLYAYNLLAHHPRENRPFTETPRDLIDVLFSFIDDARLFNHHEGRGLLNHGWPRLVMWRLGERWERQNTRSNLDAATQDRIDALDRQLAYLLMILEERGADYNVEPDRFQAAAATVRLFKIERYLRRTEGSDGTRMMRYIRGINDTSYKRVEQAAKNVLYLHHGHLNGDERHEMAENIASATMRHVAHGTITL